jgi:AcrR family transcriptional regulator
MVHSLSMASARDALLTRVIDEVAANGLSDRSLRDVAASVGTSHRLLLYHFGSRPGLVAAVVERVESDQRAALRELAAGLADPVELVRALWRQVSSDAVRPLVRLFFEAIAYTAQRADADRLTASWLDESEAVTAGLGIEFDPVDVRLGIAVVRGLLIDVVVTGDVTAADASLERFLHTWRR